MALGSFHWNSINSTIDMTEVVFNGILFTRNTIIIKKNTQNLFRSFKSKWKDKFSSDLVALLMSNLELKCLF